MADLTSFTKPNTATKPAMRSPRSTTGFLLKSLICAIFLFALPLFPSEAPAFISSTPFTNLWELLHLLFIGIAVSYGLFSRRNAENHNGASDFPESYSSRMERFLSIFDDGCRENGQLQSWDNGQSQGGNFALDGKLKQESFDSRNDVQIPCGYPQNTEVQSWNSQYFQCPPMIVVARPNYNLDNDIDDKPLGLPVRSLRSRTAEPVRIKPRTRGGSCSGAGSVDPSIGSDSCKYGNYGESGPLNSEEKFDETVSLPSPIPWHSRSETMELRRDSKPTALKQPLHSRHLSVEESQFRHHKSRSIRSSASFGSHGSSLSSSSPNQRSSTRSAIPDFLEAKMEDVREKKRDLQSSQSSFTASVDNVASKFFGSNSPEIANKASPEKTMWENSRCERDYSEDGTLNSMNAREYSKHAQKFRNGPKYSSDDERQDIPEKKLQAHGSHSRDRVSSSFPCSNDHGNLNEDNETAGWGSRREDRSNSSYTEGSVQGSSNLNVNPQVAKTRASFRGKSVRTFRANGKGMESIEQTCEDKTPKTEQQTHDLLRQSYTRKKEELSAFGNEFVFSNEDAVERPPHVARPKSWKYQIHDEKKLQDGEITDSKAVEFRADSNYDAGNDIDSVSDAGTEAHEVDRKAGEFIAKFREQIRLQKAGSMDASSVLDVTEDHYQ